MKVVFRPRAEDDLNRLYDHVAGEAGPGIAFELIQEIRDACLSLASFPNRGAARDHIIAGLRILPLQRRSVIVYRVNEQVEIIGVFHGGQDWITAILSPES